MQGERLTFAQGQKARDMVDITVRQHYGSDRCMAGAMPRMHRRIGDDLLPQIG